MRLNSLYNAAVTLVLKPVEDITRKVNYRSASLVNIDAETVMTPSPQDLVPGRKGSETVEECSASCYKQSFSHPFPLPRTFLCCEEIRLVTSPHLLSH